MCVLMCSGFFGNSFFQQCAPWKLGTRANLFGLFFLLKLQAELQLP